jgi:hypothetical protein
MPDEPLFGPHEPRPWPDDAGPEPPPPDTWSRDWEAYDFALGCPSGDDMPAVADETRRRFLGLPDALIRRCARAKWRLSLDALDDIGDADPNILYSEGHPAFSAWTAHYVLDIEAHTLFSMVKRREIDERTLTCVRVARTMLNEFEGDVTGLVAAIEPRVPYGRRWVDEWLLRRNPYYEAGRSQTRAERFRRLSAAVHLIADLWPERLESA